VCQPGAQQLDVAVPDNAVLDRSGTGAGDHSGRDAASQEDLLMISRRRGSDVLAAAAMIAAAVTMIGLLMLFVIYKL
jgi:hypothetical protein